MLCFLLGMPSIYTVRETRRAQAVRGQGRAYPTDIAIHLKSLAIEPLTAEKKLSTAGEGFPFRPANDTHDDLWRRGNDRDSFHTRSGKQFKASLHQSNASSSEVHGSCKSWQSHSTRLFIANRGGGTR
jgi:hypothetical protein